MNRLRKSHRKFEAKVCNVPLRYCISYLLVRLIYLKTKHLKSALCTVFCKSFVPIDMLNKFIVLCNYSGLGLWSCFISCFDCNFSLLDFQ